MTGQTATGQRAAGQRATRKFVHDAAVVGGGPAGLAAALALARSGVDTALVATPPGLSPQGPTAPPDTRTAALFGGSIRLLVNLGLWDVLAPLSAPIAAIRLVDDTGGLLKAPETTFTARLQPSKLRLSNRYTTSNGCRDLVERVTRPLGHSSCKQSKNKQEQVEQATQLQIWR